MEKKKQVLAIDFGASSGRVMMGAFDGRTIGLEEIHRFSNDPVMLGQTMYWDVLRLFHEIKQGLVRAKAYGSAESIGIDTWGVDFGLLDREGRLLENPVHYRDARTKGMPERCFQRISPEELYEITGNQIMDINTLFQLLSLSEGRRELLEQADTLLFMPDLFQYFLTGNRISEYSIASTSQMMDVRRREWSAQLLDTLGIPGHMLRPIVPTGTGTGSLTSAIVGELGVGRMEVVAVAGHDTQCAVAAVPAREKEFIFISCGTWSLLGTELPEPIVDQRSRRLNITNEGGYQGRISFLKNITGLWLVQESRRQWMREGREYSFGELESLAAQARPFLCGIDPEAAEFVPAGNMPERIRSYVAGTGQGIPETPGEIVRCINESLAFSYRRALEEIESCTGKRYPAIHMVGGGTKSRLLCQMTANACGRPVIAGPGEATVFGNAALQLLAAGEIGTLEEAREIIANSEEVLHYEPQETEAWEEAYQCFFKA